MLTGAQIRSARHGLRWTVQDLARRADISVSTIKRLEIDDGVPTTSTKSLIAIKAALEVGGIEFVGTPEDGPGIRIHARPGS